MKVLVVDDHAIMRRMVRSMLDKSWTVIEAGNGQEGLAAAVANPDLNIVFTDYNMPSMNGIQMLEGIRREVPAFAAKMVFISSERDANLIVAAKNLGITLWLPKPFKKEDLEQVLKAAV